MPVTAKEREDMRKLDATARDAAINEQLKRIREGSTGPGTMDHVVINDALDRIEALQSEKKSDGKAAEQPAAHPFAPTPLQPSLPSAT